MLITFLDDSVAFDGNSGAKHALGGSEKGLVALAVALCRRGHTVRVFNRCTSACVVDGVSWQPIETCEAAHSDWLISNRKPTLLSHVPNADRIGLWVGGHAGYLANAKPLKAMKSRKPTLLLQVLAQSITVPHSLQVSAAEVVPPATLDCYRNSEGMLVTEPKRVVVTTHPKSGLNWLLELWYEQISNHVPDTELHIYSALLSRDSDVGVPSEGVATIFRLMAENSNATVKIFKPVPDIEMVDVYRRARAHVYPGDDRDLVCSTLADSQAVGVPAVARDIGGACERILHGRSGFVASDDGVFRDRVIDLIKDDEIFWKAHKIAKSQQAKRSWDDVANDLERIFS
jgi:hypothetical protein